MDEKERFAFYEKVYFYELERKEKLFARLNMPLAMLVATVTFLSYMLNNAPTAADGFSGVLFWIFYLCAGFSAFVGGVFFRLSWSLRDFDKGLPTSLDLEVHRRSYTDNYENYWDNEDEAHANFRRIVFDYYIEGATVNAENNDKRGNYLKSLANCVTVSLFLAMMSFFPFYIHQQESMTNERAKTTSASTAPNEIRPRS